MNNNRKCIWKITASVLAILLMLTLLSTAVSAKCTVYKTPLGAGTPPATQHLSCCTNECIDYTVVAASNKDPRIVQFKDRSIGEETAIFWDFGDGTSLKGTKITSALKNPVHKYKKTGYYISCMTIKCNGCNEMMWVHKTVIVK